MGKFSYFNSDIQNSAESPGVIWDMIKRDDFKGEVHL